MHPYHWNPGIKRVSQESFLFKYFHFYPTSDLVKTRTNSVAQAEKSAKINQCLHPVSNLQVQIYI